MSQLKVILVAPSFAVLVAGCTVPTPPDTLSCGGYDAKLLHLEVDRTAGGAVHAAMCLRR